MSFIKTPIGEFRLVRLLGKGKSGYSHLAEGPQGQCVIKLMHDEPCDYYHFGDNKVESEIYAYQILREIGINIPKLIFHDSENKYLIKEYLDGPTGAEWLINGGHATKILADYFKNGDPLSINTSAESGKPVTEPFQETVDRWIEMYSEELT